MGAGDTTTVYGCTDPTAINYDSNATDDDGSCEYGSFESYGCMSEEYLEYDPDATVHDPTLCLTEIIYGCTDAFAPNFDENATSDDGTCQTKCGCGDPLASNFLMYYFPSNGGYYDENECPDRACDYPDSPDFEDDEEGIEFGFFTPVFIIKEISTSRKEVRLMARTPVSLPYNVDQNHFMETLGLPDVTADPEARGSDANPYLYDWVLGFSEGRNIPIVNYTFDSITDPDTPTIIVRLNSPVPSDIGTLTQVMLVKEVLNTQVQSIFFSGEGVSVLEDRVGLEDPNFGGLINVDVEDPGEYVAESYNEIISGSTVQQTSISKIFSSSYHNINIDYSEFSNHTFFGSATQKLENFKKKAGNIEGYLTKISHSLDQSGSSVVDQRKDWFNSADRIVSEFTPYENFMYFDNQSYSTASAPGLGQNLGQLVPFASSSATQSATFTALNNFDGFGTVHKFNTAFAPSGSMMPIFNGLYRAENKPFFNYSGSIYLSFLLRAPSALSGSSHLGADSTSDIPVGFSWINNNSEADVADIEWPPPKNNDEEELFTYHGQSIPATAFSSQSLVAPTGSSGITGSSYKRFVFAASQSYWRVPDGYGVGMAFVSGTFDPNTASSYEILSSSVHVQSASTVNPNNFSVIGEYYKSICTQQIAESDPDIASEVSGAILPSGDLFSISIPRNYNGDVVETASYFTNINITKNNPTDIPPFGSVYQTGSSTWSNWYTPMYESASAFDSANIHSLENNIPSQVRNSSQAGDLKKFLAMIGEHFDVIRNYIDNYTKIYSRKYKKQEAVPSNLLPMIAKNFGWELIQPFSSSLADYFGSTTGDSGGVEETKFNLWKKVINNLIYIYKSKGTEAGIRALLNVYGYPSDVISIHELGGSTQPHNPEVIKDDSTKLTAGLGSLADNVSFLKSTDIIYTYAFTGENQENRILKLDWGLDGVSSPETVEFMMKPQQSFNEQIILENSGSGAEKLWDLRLERSGSDSAYGKLAFRINDSRTGSFVSSSGQVNYSSSLIISTSYLEFKKNKIWNVMLQRETSSITSSGTQTYKLFVGLQNEDKIVEFVGVSASISGGLEISSDAGNIGDGSGLTGSYYINENWAGTGSRNKDSGSNLFVGRTFTGSIGEFRVWNEPLSASKFKQHILNKKSTVGNTITSSKASVYYHFRLNEGYLSGSLNPTASDANPKTSKDYSFNISSDILTGSTVAYDKTEIDIYKFSLRTGGVDQPNSNKILINPVEPVIGNLSVDKSSIRTIYSPIENKRKTSNEVQIVRSPQRVLNMLAVDKIQDFDITERFGDPNSLYSESFDDLEQLRKDIFDHFDVSLDVNKWIRGQVDIFRGSLIESVKSVLPGRTTIENVGLLFEPTVLERSKIKYHPINVYTGSDAGELIATDMDVTNDYISYSGSKFEAMKEASYNVHSNISLTQSKFEARNEATYSVVDDISLTQSKYVARNEATYSINDNVSFTQSKYVARNEATYSVTDVVSYTGSKNIAQNEATYSVTNALSYTGSKRIVYTEATYSVIDNIAYTGSKIIMADNPNSYDSPSPGHENYIVSKSVESFIDYRTAFRGWGTGSDYVHFVNYAFSGSGTGPINIEHHGSGDIEIDRWRNTWHWEYRDTFMTVGDSETVSGSNLLFSTREYEFHTDFSNPDNFKNRMVEKKILGKKSGSNAYDYKYDSWFDDKKGTQVGKPVGKTAYFITASAAIASAYGYESGMIIYPTNHWIRYSEDGMRDNFINGYQNKGGYYQHSSNREDYSTSSFYTVDLGEETEIFIRRGTPKKDDTTGIISYEKGDQT
tara:strand:- start:2460 stop:7838 length:5379 start_codon:yes stop_codon:yes gene_type:complete